MPGKSLVNILVISVARAWPWMACDYSEMYLLLAKSMVSAMLFTAFVQPIQKSFVMLFKTFYWHVANLWSLLCTNQMLHLLRDESCVVWCYFYSPLCPESCILKLWWQWVHTVYNLAFCISPVVLLKSFVAAQRAGFQQTIWNSCLVNRSTPSSVHPFPCLELERYPLLHPILSVGENG